MLLLNDSKLSTTLMTAYETFAQWEQTDTFWSSPLETALNAPFADVKRYCEFDARMIPKPPEALQALRSLLIEIIQKHSYQIEQEWGPLTKNLEQLMDRGNGPVLRISIYPAGLIGIVNHPHNDIDLFTVIPSATQPGLEIESDDCWKSVKIASNELILLSGELIHVFGGPQPTLHRVVSNGSLRMSASLFVNADPALQINGTSVGSLVAQRLAHVRGEHHEVQHRNQDDGEPDHPSPS